MFREILRLATSVAMLCLVACFDDNPSDASVPRGYRRETRTVRKGDVLAVKMSSSGGFCGTIADKH